MASKSTKGFSNRVLNVLPSTSTENDWTYQDAMMSRAAVAAPAAAPLSVDLRSKDWAINDQMQTGSCVGWATADGLLRWHLVNAGKLGPKTLLSSRFVWMASKETDEFDIRPGTFIEEAGTSIKAAVDVIRKYGCPTDAELPFKIDTLMYSGKETLLYASASTRRAANYFNLFKNGDQWKTWLSSNGPILAALYVDKNWLNAKVTDGKLDQFDQSTVAGAHAVAIVGYTTSHFIVRNSWGTDWGDKGFAYITPTYLQAAFFNESYGITV